MEIKELADILQRNGVVGAGGAGFPTYAKLDKRAETIIMNCAECEPLLKLHRQLLEKHADEIVSVFHLIMETVGAKEAIIGIKKAYKKTIEALKGVIPQYPGVRLGLLDEVYPAGDEVVLIYEVTGKVVRPGGLPIECGVCVFNVETCYNLARALNRHEPVVDKLVSVVAEVNHPVTLRMPIGATMEDAVRLAGGAKIKDPVYFVGGVMMGKILGVAAVAAVQVLIWGVLICGVSALAMPALIPSDIMQSVEAMQQGTLDMTQTDMDVDMLRAIGTATDFGYLASIFVWLLLFIIGGYLLYSAIFAAIGSSVDSVQDAQQLQTPVMMPIIFSIIIMMTILNDPNSTLAVWCSYIPFTSPVVMMARIPSGVPVWQIAVSLVILYATFVAAVWFAAKIYRVGIFMYGKKPSFKELWKWVRYKY